jgi:hypothetical protein
MVEEVTMVVCVFHYHPGICAGREDFSEAAQVQQSTRVMTERRKLGAGIQKQVEFSW